MISRGLLVAAALSVVPVSGWAQEQAEPLEAGKENTGRVSVIEGTELFGRGPYDEETWELSINAVVREGDELFTEDGTFAELEMPGQTFVRLDGGTTIVIQRVSEQGIEFALANGSVYVSRGSSAQPVLVQTFGGAVDLGGNSMARVGGDFDKTKIDVKVVKGSAEMRTDKTAIAVPEGKTLAWTRTGSRNQASGAVDDFDRWNENRESTVRGTSRPSHVASSAMGSYELEGAGTWVMIDGYYAWQPTAVAVDWRPYSNGYWAWTEPWGWTWCDYYGWGYTTSHYGRWYHRSSYGWVWYPDPYWGAAWVVWAAFGPHMGWAPCDYWGRPIYVHSYYSYYDYGAWCYSDADYFYSGGGYRPRGVRTSTSRSTSRNVTSIGRNASHSIRKFDQNTIREHSPVPVRNATRELTPKHVAKAAERGAIKGVRAEQRRGDFLARAVKEGGVRPEPWAADRSRSRDNGASSLRGGSDKSRGFVGDDRSGGRNPARSAEGWGAPGRNDANRSSDGGSSRGATGPSWDRGGSSNDRGSNNVWTPPSRGDTRSDTQDRGWTPPARSNDSGSSRGNDRPSYTPPARGNDSAPSRGNSQPSYTPPARSNDSRPAPQPQRQDNDSGRKSNDSGSKSKPRSSWSNPSTSDSYSYGSRGGRSSGSSRANSASSYSQPSRSKSNSASSWSAPSRSSSKKSARSYSAPSRSKSSYSAPKSSRSSSKSYSAPKSSRSSSKSYSAPKSSSRSSSSKSSGSSKSSSSKSSKRRR